MPSVVAPSERICTVVAAQHMQRSMVLAQESSS